MRAEDQDRIASELILYREDAQRACSTQYALRPCRPWTPRRGTDSLGRPPCPQTDAIIAKNCLAIDDIPALNPLRVILREQAYLRAAFISAAFCASSRTLASRACSAFRNASRASRITSCARL